MNRITDRDLNGMISRLNKITGNPETYATKGDDGRHTINIGHYHLDRAYGGQQLVQTVTAGGGVRDVLGSGHVSRRECYERIYAYLRGIEDMKEAA